MKQISSDCVDLDTACKVLAKSRSVQAELKDAVGTKDFSAALAMMKAGKLVGDLGASIHDLLTDSIQNDANQVWKGFIRQPHDDYPVRVNEYHGIYWVWAMEYDPIGYFLDKENAESFAQTNWENVYEEGEDPEDEEEEEEESECPYCSSTDDCDHLLVRVDVNFQEAVDGPLWEEFNSAWSDRAAEETENPDFDPREAFDELLDEINGLADFQTTTSPDSAPGISTTWAKFFCSSKWRTRAAVKKFNRP